jgi:Enoyl-CoA hydratase/carnithine racemase
MPGLDFYRTKIDEYADKYKDFMLFERDDLGVLTVRLQTNGGASLWSNFNHRACSQAWADIGRDPENQVVVLTGTDGDWLKMPRMPDGWEGGWDMFWTGYAAQLRFFESFIHNIEVPTIGALSSVGFPLHLEPALASDLTICSDISQFGDLHFSNHGGNGNPAGDGTALALEELIGRKRMAYLVYTGKLIDAPTALDWGIVNEVLPVDQVLPRAQEIGREIVQAAPVGARRLQSQMFKREWKKRLAHDWAFHLSHEILGIAMNQENFVVSEFKNPNEPSPR